MIHKIKFCNYIFVLWGVSCGRVRMEVVNCLVLCVFVIGFLLVLLVRYVSYVPFPGLVKKLVDYICPGLSNLYYLVNG